MDGLQLKEIISPNEFSLREKKSFLRKKNLSEKNVQRIENQLSRISSSDFLTSILNKLKIVSFTYNLVIIRTAYLVYY